MKYKTTAKALKQGYYHIVRVGYCDLQNLLSYKTVVAYSSGIYGWNFDVYDIAGVAIVTGYRGMPCKNTSVSYSTIQEYEKKAEGKTEQEKDRLINEFLKASTIYN